MQFLFVALSVWIITLLSHKRRQKTHVWKKLLCLLCFRRFGNTTKCFVFHISSFLIHCLFVSTFHCISTLHYPSSCSFLRYLQFILLSPFLLLLSPLSLLVTPPPFILLLSSHLLVPFSCLPFINLFFSVLLLLS